LGSQDGAGCPLPVLLTSVHTPLESQQTDGWQFAAAHAVEHVQLPPHVAWVEDVQLPSSKQHAPMHGMISQLALQVKTPPAAAQSGCCITSQQSPGTQQAPVHSLDGLHA
jgi:hypothetical protein